MRTLHHEAGQGPRPPVWWTLYTLPQSQNSTDHQPSLYFCLSKNRMPISIFSHPPTFHFSDFILTEYKPFIRLELIQRTRLL